MGKVIMSGIVNYLSNPKKIILVDIPTITDSLTYNGSTQSPTINGLDEIAMQVSGTTSAVNSGTYTITVTLNNGYGWSDGTFESKNIFWKILNVQIAIPTVASNPTYTGSSVSPTWNNYDTSKMTISGTTSSINVGSYNAVFTLKTNYEWTDGTTETKNVTWLIKGKSPDLQVRPKGAISAYVGSTIQITVFYEGSGNITISQLNKTYFDATINSNANNKCTINIRGIKDNSGNTTSAINGRRLTIKIAASGNYASQTKTVTVNVS